jgi:hypothetical protein
MKYLTYTPPDDLASIVYRYWSLEGKLPDEQKINYGIGWRQDSDNLGRTYVHNGGSSIGGRSFLLLYPNEGLSIAITSNLSTNFDQIFVLKIAELFIE